MAECCCDAVVFDIRFIEFPSLDAVLLQLWIVPIEKFSIRFKMASRDELDVITNDLGSLRITRDSDLEDDLSPISDPGCAEKRVKTGSNPISRYRTATGTILDPLLFLRVNHQFSDSISDSTVARSPDPPSLDEIFSEGRSKNPASGQATRQKKHARDNGVRSKESKVRVPQAQPLRLPLAVFRFCQDNQVKYTPISISKTFRSIAFSRSREASECDPWDRFIDANSLSHYRMCHAVYFGFRREGEEGRVVAVVPHHSRKSALVDMENLSRELGYEVFKISLSQMEKELGFPTFVCPPFGHEFAPKMHASDRKPRFLTAIDQSLVLSESMTDCVFELGSVGLRLRPGELRRLAANFNWRVIDQLVRPI